ncbi:MAG: tyrosine-type recombinase/integrase [Alphaproteobacteria bacterium]|nr:tyrosine-type recombinase/integrase [Alphaproteobacteria bacterium]
MPEKLKLTKRSVENAEIRPKRYRINDTDQPGFCLFVYPTGRKKFAVRYVTAEGKNSDQILGEYPSLLPEKARDMAAKVRADVRSDKKDPGAERKATRKKGVEKRERTFKRLGELYLAHEERRSGKRLSTLQKARYQVEAKIVPGLGHRIVSEVDHTDIMEFLLEVQAEAAKRSGGTGAGAANDARKYLLQLFKHAHFLKWIELDPMQHIEKFPEKPRTRRASDEELRALWTRWDAKATGGDPRAVSGALALQFMALTLQRGEEVASMRWEEIDWKRKVWTLPEGRKKEGREAVVPLSSQAVAVLEAALEMNGDHEGPFAGRDGDGTLKRNSLTQVFRRDCEVLGIENLTPHDLRRTGRTAITDPERIGMEPHVGELVLNHATGSGLQRTYDLNAYLPDKRRALEAWGRLVERIAAGEEATEEAASNVVRFPA